jgi:predicted HTH transcriptional regulator
MPLNPGIPLLQKFFIEQVLLSNGGRNGTGTLNIIKWCKENQNPPPLWEEQPSSVMITFLPSTFFLEEAKEEPVFIANENQATGQVSGQVSGQDKILEFCKQPRTAKEIMKLMGVKHRESFYKNYLHPLMQKEFLLMTVPDKPQSRNQQYFTNPHCQHGRVANF